MSVPYDATHVAGLVISRCEANGKPLSSGKLQSLLYFVQMQFIREDNTVCFRDSIFAGKNGPYILKVQERLEDFPDGEIPFEELKQRFPYEKKLDPHSMSVLHRAIDPASSMPEKVLVETAYSQRPYKVALETEAKKILTQEIRAYFKKPQKGTIPRKIS